MYKEHDVLQSLYDYAVTSLEEGTDVPLPPKGYARHRGGIEK